MKKKQKQYYCAFCKEIVSKNTIKCPKCGLRFKDNTKYALALCIVSIFAIIIIIVSIVFTKQVQNIFITGTKSINNIFKKAENIFSENKVLICEKNEKNENGYNEFTTVELTYKDNKVLKVKNTNIKEMEKDVADTSFAFATLFANALNKLDGINADYSKENNTIKTVFSIELDKIDLKALKETLGDAYEQNSFYAEKDITLDHYKQKNLENYTCK